MKTNKVYRFRRGKTRIINNYVLSGNIGVGSTAKVKLAVFILNFPFQLFKLKLLNAILWNIFCGNRIPEIIIPFHRINHIFRNARTFCIAFI